MDIFRDDSAATNRLTNMLLTELEGFEERGNVVVIGATNKPWDLSQNLLRRFDRKIYVKLPDMMARKIFIEKLLNKGRFQSLISEKEVGKLVADSDRMSCDDLQNIYNKAVDIDAIRPVMEANHFTQKYVGGDGDSFCPCHCNLESCIRLRLEDLPSSCILFAPLSMSTFSQIMLDTNPSNDALSLKKFEHFRKYGSKLMEESKKPTTETTGDAGGCSSVGAEIFCLFLILILLLLYVFVF